MFDATDLRDDKDYLTRRISSMDRDFATFSAHYKELAEYTKPRRGRFYVTDHNKGTKRHKSIINNWATVALRRATSGMFAGAMSPSRPWFTWDMMDKSVLQDKEVQGWLDLFKRTIYLVANKSNFYNMAPTMLSELLLFATGCMTHEDDFDDVARFYTHTAGSYRIAQNDKLVPNAMSREFQMTVENIVAKFGLENVSVRVKNDYDRSNYLQYHTVHNLIELNPFRDKKEAVFSSEFLDFRSVYWEKGTDRAEDKSKFLSRTGYKGFPAYITRWDVTGEDVYGTDCPGMTTLGDVKQLQYQEKELAKGVAKSHTPPLQGPPSLGNHPIANLPGGITLATTTNAKIEKLYDVDPRVQEEMMDINRTERRISTGYYNDLFRAITDMEGIQPKNQLQLSQINEERLLELGPVLEQIHGEWLAKVVNRIGDQILAAGIMPPPPEKLQGNKLNIEFISALAMAQRSVATGAIERVVGFAGMLTESGWDMRAKIDPDFAIDEYSSLVGSPPQLILSTESAKAARQAEAEKLQQQEQMQMAMQAAQTAQTASNAKLGDKNVLSEAINNAPGQ